jgi:hypothetical protein
MDARRALAAEVRQLIVVDPMAALEERVDRAI